jgi:hypothetical protein
LKPEIEKKAVDERREAINEDPEDKNFLDKTVDYESKSAANDDGGAPFHTNCTALKRERNIDVVIGLPEAGASCDFAVDTGIR